MSVIADISRCLWTSSVRGQNTYVIGLVPEGELDMYATVYRKSAVPKVGRDRNAARAAS
jgi:hypothetical protein